MRKLVLYYLYTFLILDMIMGFLLVSLNLQSVLVLNPGQIVRTILLGLILIVFLKDILEKFNSINSHILLSLLYFGVFVIVIYLNGGYWGAELNNVSKLIFILMLVYYINKHKDFFLEHFNSIMHVNFYVLTINLVFGYITGLGIDTYGESMNATKGFIYSGNAVSILSLVFLAYFIFRLQEDSKAKYLILLAIVNIFIVGTKAIFIVPVVILIYLFTKIRWTVTRVLITSSVLIPIIIAVIIAVAPLITQVYQSRYLDMLERTGVSIENNGGGDSVEQAILAYRRITFATKQVEKQFTEPAGLLFGYGESGQYEFWTEKGYSFTFAGMDFIDFLFEYGLFGSLLFYSIIFYPLISVIKRWEFNPLTISFIFIFLYSFFGGYVIYNTTASTMFSLLIGLNLPPMNWYKNSSSYRLHTEVN